MKGATRSATRAASGATARKSATPARGRAVRPVLAPVRVVRVRELDPIARCGPSTSVEALYRVDESLDGRPAVHLVFLDRHGWYCIHGRGCAAVADVQRERRLARRS